MSSTNTATATAITTADTKTEDPIYLDYNATTPIADEVAAAMAPYLFNKGFFGNPSSTHPYGRRAKLAVEAARAQVAGLLGCREEEVTFTSGGTESNNTAIKCTAPHYIITSAIEHPAVAEVCDWLRREHGAEVSVMPVDSEGVVDLGALEAAVSAAARSAQQRGLPPTSVLITVMYANNEIGAIQPIARITEIGHRYGALVHTDAAQAVGKVSVDVNSALGGVDMVSIAGHKLYAPKGVGALYVRAGAPLACLAEKLMHGASHEQNRRAGTENVLEIVGLGKACEIAKRDLAANVAHMRTVRDALWDAIVAAFPTGGVGRSNAAVRMNGSADPARRLPNTLSVSFRGIHASALLSEVGERVAASAGAACHAAGDEISISATLKAIGLPVEWAMGTVRLSVGRETTVEEVSRAADILCTAARALQQQQEQQEGEDDACPVGDGDISNVRLTQYSHGMGCACKLRPRLLEKVLAAVPFGEACRKDSNLLVGLETGDDAAVYRISDDLALVHTVDFFTPVCDDPYDFGAVAAANALSDVYAMGARPITALSVAAFPQGRLPLAVLERILRGALDKCQEAGIAIAGGHTVEDPEPKFGLCVSGVVNPALILRNSGMRQGDVLVLTKPLGVGLLSAAAKRRLVDPAGPEAKAAIALMTTLNRAAAEAAADPTVPRGAVHACTDVTGFGLLGHLREMVLGCGTPLAAVVDAAKVPVLPKARAMAVAGAVPGATAANLEHAGTDGLLEFGENVTPVDKLILADPQTSGGLLFAVEESALPALLDALKAHGVKEFAAIGKVTEADKAKIVVN